MITKESYMQQLDQHLQSVPIEKRHEMMYDYAAHFQMAMENGQLESDIAKELGDPQIIARELLLGYRVDQAEGRQTAVSVSRAVLATVSLGFFNLVFVLGPFLGMMGIVLALWALTAALGIMGAAFILDGYTSGMFKPEQGLSLGAICIGFCLLASVGMRKLTRAIFGMTIKYLKWNTRMIKEKS